MQPEIEEMLAKYEAEHSAEQTAMEQDNRAKILINAGFYTKGDVEISKEEFDREYNQNPLDYNVVRKNGEKNIIIETPRFRWM